jgi:hypothetical protein
LSAKESSVVKATGFIIEIRQKLAFIRDSKKKDRNHAKRGKAFSLISIPKRIMK